MLTWIILVVAFILIVILVDEFSSPRRTWRESHRRTKRKTVE